LEQGADINLSYNFGGSHLTLYAGILIHIEALMDEDIMDKDEFKKMANVLFKSNPDLSKKTRSRLTPLGQSLAENAPKSALIFIDWGADVFADGNLLIMATSIVHELEGVSDVVKRLIEKGYDPNTSSEDGTTYPIILAAENSQVEAIEVLLAHGADVNKTDRIGATALMWACGAPVTQGVMFTRTRQHEMIPMLLTAGADPTIKSNQKRKALGIFKKCEHIYDKDGLTADEIRKNMTELLENAEKKFSNA